jgi:flagellin-specific chaperone FliS
MQPLYKVLVKKSEVKAMNVSHPLRETLGTLHRIAFDLDQFSSSTSNESTRLLYTRCLQNVEQVIHVLEQKQHLLTHDHLIENEPSLQ